MTKVPRRVTSDTGELSQFTLHKAKNSRRKRLLIRRLKYTCQRKTRIRNGNVTQNGDVSDGNDERNRNEQKAEISLTFCSSLEHRNSVVSSGFGDRAAEDTRSVARGSHGWVSVIGRRREMEDAVRVELGFAVKGMERYDFYGVYDGHSGGGVAEACRKRLHAVVAAEMAAAEAEVESSRSSFWERVMEVGFTKMDDEVGDTGGSIEVNTVGSTAVVAVVGPEEVVVANCGDSRAVLSRGGVAVALSIDHKPDRVDELERIESAGGKVINWNGHRVLGVLATSRSIGDHHLKPYVISKPEVTIIERTDADEFLILASDGLWDVVSNETASQYVKKCLNGLRLGKGLAEIVHEKRAAKAAALLAELAISRGSKDNISVIVIELKKPQVS